MTRSRLQQYRGAYFNSLSRKPRETVTQFVRAKKTQNIVILGITWTRISGINDARWQKRLLAESNLYVKKCLKLLRLWNQQNSFLMTSQARLTPVHTTLLQLQKIRVGRHIICSIEIHILYYKVFTSFMKYMPTY